MSTSSHDLLARLAAEYDLDLIYGYGSRSKDLLAWAAGHAREPLRGTSDADIGVKSTRPLTIREKVTLRWPWKMLSELGASIWFASTRPTRF